jgi:hypothetical protein
VVAVPDRLVDPIYVELEELRARLEERERRELEDVRRALSTDASRCRCCSCVEADVQAREDQEYGRRWGRWNRI